MPDDPLVSIIIPVFNEEKIIRAAINSLVTEVEENFDWEFELIITENGSSDNTVPIARELAARYPNIRVLHHPEPNYGHALREGIRQARGTYIISDEIDLCDTRFYESALAILEKDEADMVIGSKRLSTAQDDRPPLRRFATWTLNMMLRYIVGFQGTDTHGLKAFNREKLLNIVDACKVDRDIFASEMVVRAERAYVRIMEIPIELQEIRPPSTKLFSRVPRALRQIFELAWHIRIRG